MPFPTVSAFNAYENRNVKVDFYEFAGQPLKQILV